MKNIFRPRQGRRDEATNLDKDAISCNGPNYELTSLGFELSTKIVGQFFVAGNLGLFGADHCLYSHLSRYEKDK